MTQGRWKSGSFTTHGRRKIEGRGRCRFKEVVCVLMLQYGCVPWAVSSKCLMEGDPL